MYEITIQKLTTKEGKDYPDRQEVYKQVVEHLELDKVIMFINQQKPAPVAPEQKTINQETK